MASSGARMITIDMLEVRDMDIGSYEGLVEGIDQCKKIDESIVINCINLAKNHVLTLRNRSSSSL